MEEALLNDSLRDQSSEDPGRLTALGTPDTPKTDPVAESTSIIIALLALRALLGEPSTEDAPERISVITTSSKILVRQKKEEDNSLTENTPNRASVVVTSDKALGK